MTGLAPLACVAAALAAALLVRPPPALPARPRPARPPRALIALLAAGPCLLVPRVGALLAIAAGATWAGVALWRQHRRRRRAVEVADRVLETCEVLAGELAAGQPPGAALDRAAGIWSPLAPVAAAFRVGGDVPASLRLVAGEVEGARDLAVVAAAWQVAHRTGQGLAVTVERLTDSLRAAAATRRVVAGELASARSTARLVAGLPVLALAMGSGAGGDPWGFLLGTTAGLACLTGGLALGFAGLWWIESIARDAETRA
ncbi:type II secretion system F family protein [Nocardioides mangrovi]|uniref:Type II secretion system F family protein n=1 Tax=Nocardioides mangrovi TaxID=2874580 RepID=A0ABS7UDY7_9ACTN|nr:type II secretion system F family protein [Nocardioides mangrovi]MBZ5739102.1 type II secretion system F family protein [Nocardioides mangrovi]